MDGSPLSIGLVAAAWLVGATGGLHCVAMCGGLLAATEARDATRGAALRPARTIARRSPRPRPCSRGTPRPRNTNSCPGWVPAWTVSSSSPSSVDSSTFVPSAAWAIEIGTSVIRSSSIRR